MIDDAVALTWIKAAPPTTLEDEEGFVTPESRKGKRGRMQTGWQ